MVVIPLGHNHQNPISSCICEFPSSQLDRIVASRHSEWPYGPYKLQFLVNLCRVGEETPDGNRLVVERNQENTMVAVHLGGHKILDRSEFTIGENMLPTPGSVDNDSCASVVGRSETMKKNSVRGLAIDEDNKVSPFQVSDVVSFLVANNDTCNKHGCRQESARGYLFWRIASLREQRNSEKQNKGREAKLMARL